MTVLRHLIGEVLRTQRVAKGLTLRQVSAAARVSLGYISEVERGQKEASSELLSALCEALDVPLSQVLRDVAAILEIEEHAGVDAALDSLGTLAADNPKVYAA